MVYIYDDGLFFSEDIVCMKVVRCCLRFNQGMLPSKMYDSRTLRLAPTTNHRIFAVFPEVGRDRPHGTDVA